MKEKHILYYVIVCLTLILLIVYTPPAIRSVFSYLEKKNEVEEIDKKDAQQNEILIKGVRQQERNLVIKNNFPYTGADRIIEVRIDPEGGDDLYFISE